MMMDNIAYYSLGQILVEVEFVVKQVEARNQDMIIFSEEISDFSFVSCELNICY